MKQRENNPLPPKLKGNHPSGQTHLKWCIFVLCLFLGVTVQAQKRISLTFQNETLVNVLKKVGDASGYKINFNTEDVQGFTVTATIQNKTATEALDIILKEKPLSMKRLGNLFLSAAMCSKPQSDQQNKNALSPATYGTNKMFPSPA